MTKRDSTLPGTPAPPGSDQVWSCLQRYLAFEEPAVKWDRLIAYVSKQIRNRTGLVKNIASLPLSDQGQYLGFVAGSPENIQNRALSLIFAVEELTRFHPSSFDTWYLALPEECEQPSEVPAPVREVASRLQATESQRAWLFHSWRSSPDWDILKKQGPWTGHPLASFMLNAMAIVSALPNPHQAEELTQAQKTFHRLLRDHRSTLPGSFLPNALALVEGPTEALLLPHFARLTRNDFDRLGIMLLACGGANQMVRRYIALSDACAIPIFVLIDGDALSQIETIRSLLRDSDRMHIWEAGEIEDTLDHSFLLTQINNYLHTMGGEVPVGNSDLTRHERRTEALDRVWRTRGLGDFDKVGFAEFLVSHMTSPEEVPREAVEVVAKLGSMVRTTV